MGSICRPDSIRGCDKTPVVSIIIPAFNVQDFVSRAIESALSQSYPLVDVVVVDDGSKDQTWQVVSSYCGRRGFRCFRQANGGVSKARNNALEQSRGDYILFLDADDWLEYNAVETLLSLQAKYGNALIATECYYVYTDASGNEKRIQQGADSLPINATSDEAVMTLGNTAKYHVGSSCYKLFSKHTLNVNSIRFNESISHTEDGLFVFKYLKACNGLHYEPIPLWNILERPGSATMSGYDKKLLTSIQAIDEMLAFPDNSPEVNAHLRIFRVHEALRILGLGIDSRRLSETEFDQLKKVANDPMVSNGTLSMIDRLRKACYLSAPYWISHIFNLIISQIKAVFK